MMEDEYRGPESISWATFPNRGRSYHMNVEAARSADQCVRKGETFTGVR